MPLPNCPLPQSCFYTINSVDQAVRHAMGLLYVIRDAALPNEALESTGLFSQQVVWLLDSLFSLFESRIYWSRAVGVSTLAFVEFVSEVLSTSHSNYGFNAVIHQKAYALLVFFCAGVIKNPRDILDEGEDRSAARQRLCVAFIQLAGESLKHKPIARLVKSQLVAPLKGFTAENPTLGSGTDFSVSARDNVQFAVLTLNQRSILLLEQAAASPRPESFKEPNKSSDFNDSDLARRVAALGLESRPDLAGPSAAKRRKLTAEPATLVQVRESLRLLLPGSPAGMSSDFGDCVMYVFPLFS